MSWFRKALNISCPEPGSYYTILSPEEFYEWRYTLRAPKGSLFSLQLPPSDILTEGKIIATAIISDEHLEKRDHGWVLKESSPVEVILTIGNMPSPQELLEKYQRLKSKFDRGLRQFKEDLIIRRYIDSQTEKPNLFRLVHWNDDKVTLHNFGSIKDLIESFAEIREILLDESMNKIGRAYELEDFRRYENAMMFVNNSHLHVDASKMDRLLETSGVKPIQTKTLSWKECFLEVSRDARLLNDVLNKFYSNKWVQAVTATNV